MSVIFTPRARFSRWKALWPLALLLAWLRARVSLSTLTPKKPMRTSVGVGQKTGIEKRFAWPPVVPLP